MTSSRALSLYLHGLLGRQVGVRQAPPGAARPFADERDCYFPAAFPMYSGELARAAGFAAAAHLAAHWRFGGPRAKRGGLKPIQLVLVALLEDARVEARLGRELPGLPRLWGRFHSARPLQSDSDLVSFESLCERLARALHDPGYPDGHPLVDKARGFFLAGAQPPSAAECRRFGSLLGNDVGQMRLRFDPRHYQVLPAYRDDHRLLWEEDAPEERLAPEVEVIDNPEDPTRRAPGPEATGAGLVEGPPGSDGLARYPEWDYLIRTSRPAWCTVRELPGPARVPRPPAPTAAEVDLRARLDRLAASLRVSAVRRQRRQSDGDSIDLDAAVEAQVDRRAGLSSSDRSYVRDIRQRQDLAVLLLLDVSASTGAPCSASPPGAAGASSTLLALARLATRMLAHLLDRTGDVFSVHAFSSDGRHQVEYHRIKDFGQAWDGEREGRLQALAPRLSTRMGAALRHAGTHLRRVRCSQRLLLLLTDGEPADIDTPDAAYLLHDAERAVGELRRSGQAVFAVSLDPGADRYMRRIFGDGRYLVLDRLQRLPELLPRLYARIAG